MERITFSTNWNKRPGEPLGGKLYCRAFTTLRLSDKHNMGDEVEIWLGDTHMGNATVEDKRQFLLHNLTPGMSYVDTGYSPEETAEIIRKMYPKADFAVQKITWYLLLYKN